MNINDNKLNELIIKTETTIQKKVKRRRYILSSSLAAAAIIIAVLVFSTGGSNVQDVVIQDNQNHNAMSDNTKSVIEETNEWSEKRDVNGIEFTVSINPHSILVPENSDNVKIKKYQVKEYYFNDEEVFKLAKYFLGEPYLPIAYSQDDYLHAIMLLEKMDTSNYSDSELEEFNKHLNTYKNIVGKDITLILQGYKLSKEADSLNTFAFRASNHNNASSSLIIGNKYFESFYPWVSYIRAENWYTYQEVNDLNNIILSDNQQTFYKKAYDLAVDAVNTFSDNMTLSSAMLSERTNLYSSPEYKDTSATNSLNNMAIVFYFTKQYPIVGIDGINAYSILKTNKSYSSDINTIDETIKVTIDKDGIAMFSCIGKTEIVEESIIADSRISLDNAIAIFKNNVFDIINSNKDTLKVDIEINKILFTFTNIKKSDGTNEIIPVYSFSGVKIVATDHKNNVWSMIDSEITFLINAIDGSIIE